LPKRVFIDCDGVLVNFLDEALYRLGYEVIKGKDARVSLRRKGETDPVDLPWEPGEWYVDRVLGISLGDFWDGVQGEDPDAFWEGLEWMEDGKAILSQAEAWWGAENICLLTSPSIGTASGKLRWIEREMPEYARAGRFLIGRAKHFVAHRDSILIDDSDHNCEKFAAEGGTGMLIPRYWNSGHAHIEAFAASVAAGTIFEGR
jgi:hypothetical protein